VTFLSYGVTDIPETDFDYSTEKYVRTDSYEFGERILGVAYAMPLSWNWEFFKNIDLGLTGKIAQSTLAGTTLTGFGLDAGVRFDIAFPRLPYIGEIGDIAFGVALQNILPPTFQEAADPDDDADPASASSYQRNIRIGAAKPFTFLSQHFIAAGDLDNNGWHFGLEYIADKSLRFRAGLDDFNLTMGLGYRMFNFGGFDGNPYTLSLDYAFRTFPEPLGNTHYVSLTILGISKTQTPQIIGESARVTASSIALSGTAQADAEVTIYVNQRLRKTVRADANGIWNADSVLLDNGQNDVYAVAQYEQYVESDASAVLVIYTDQIKPEVTTEITSDGAVLFIRARLNKQVSAVATRLPNDTNIVLRRSSLPNEWTGSWTITPEYANAYINLRTIAVDEFGNRSEIVEDVHSTRFVNSPRDRTVTAEKIVYVRGTAKKGAALISAGGASVTPDAETGRYILPVEMTQEGKNVLDIMMVSAEGASVTTSLRVLKVREADDLQGYSALKNQVTALLTLGVLDNDRADQTKFRPADYLTRAEFARALAVIKALPLNAARPAGAVDVQGEYAPYINAVLEAGYMNVLPEGFVPNAFITRKDAVSAIVRMDELDTGRADSTRQVFADVPAYMPYAPQVAAAVNAGIISPAENFYPDRELTRAEAAAMLSASREARAKTNELYNWKTGYGAQFEENTLSSLGEAERAMLSDIYVNGRLISFEDTDTGNLKVLAPRDRDIADRQTIEIKGLLKTGEQVTINGIAVPVQKGAFLAQLKLNDGRNIVRVEGGGETRVLRVLYVQPYADRQNTLDNLKFNMVRRYVNYSDGSLSGGQTITRGEALRILYGIRGQTGDMSSTENISFAEAVRLLNAWDSKPADSTAVSAGFTDPGRPLTREEFINLLASTDTYRNILNRYANFEGYEQENVPRPAAVEDRSDVLLQAENLGQDPDKKKITNPADDFNSFLNRYDRQRLSNAGTIARTGDSIAADGRTELIVIYPQNNFRVNDALLTVRGFSGGEAEARVNGRRVRAAADSSFELSLNLEPGRNTILVENTRNSIRLTGLRLLTYSDIQNIQERGAIEYLATAGYFKEGAEFFPDKEITREEAAALFVRMLNITPQQIFQDVFRDVQANRWSAPSIKLLVDRGVIKDQNTFRPDEAITQQEAYDWFRALSRAELQIEPRSRLTRRNIVRWLFADERVRAEIDALNR
jgi:hypothetical protein